MLAFTVGINKLTGMKLFWVTLAHVLIAVVLGGGVILLMAGKPALFIGGLLVYTLVFAKVGCASQ